MQDYEVGQAVDYVAHCESQTLMDALRKSKVVVPRKYGGAATYPTKFDVRWKLKYPCICEVPDNRHLFLCMVCTKVLSCSHQGLADVKRHINSRGHFEKVRRFGNIEFTSRSVNGSIHRSAIGKKETQCPSPDTQSYLPDQHFKSERQDDDVERNSDAESLENGIEKQGPSRMAKTKKREDYIHWPDYFMAIAFLSAMRSKDPSSQVGACIVNPENKIVGIGYNGMPNGCSDDELPWDREASDPLDTKYMYVCHAEMNAILNKNSADIRGGIIYVALFPCNECAKLIIQSGIGEVVYLSDKYHDDPKMVASRRLLDMAGVLYRQHLPRTNKIVIDFDSINRGQISTT